MAPKEVELNFLKGAMTNLAAKFLGMAEDLRTKPPEPIHLDPADTLSKVDAAAKALAQQSRATFFLDVFDCKLTDATACLTDLEKACTIYHSWAKPLLAAVSPAARKVATGPCAQVLILTHAMLNKMAARTITPADLGQLDAAVEALAALPVRGTDAARGLLQKSEELLADALEEVSSTIAEAAEENEDEDEDEEGEDEEEELFGQPAFSAPLRRMVDEARALVRRAHEAGLERLEPEDKTAGILAASAQAASAQVDSLVCAMHEEDREARQQGGGRATCAGRHPRPCARLVAARATRCYTIRSAAAAAWRPPRRPELASTAAQG